MSDKFHKMDDPADPADPAVPAVPVAPPCPNPCKTAQELICEPCGRTPEVTKACCEELAKCVKAGNCEEAKIEKSYVSLTIRAKIWPNPLTTPTLSCEPNECDNSSFADQLEAYTLVITAEKEDPEEDIEDTDEKRKERCNNDSMATPDENLDPKRMDLDGDGLPPARTVPKPGPEHSRSFNFPIKISLGAVKDLLKARPDPNPCVPMEIGIFGGRWATTKTTLVPAENKDKMKSGGSACYDYVSGHEPNYTFPKLPGDDDKEKKGWAISCTPKGDQLGDLCNLWKCMNLGEPPKDEEGEPIITTDTYGNFNAFLEKKDKSIVDCPNIPIGLTIKSDVSAGNVEIDGVIDIGTPCADLGADEPDYWNPQIPGGKEGSLTMITENGEAKAYVDKRYWSSICKPTTAAAGENICEANIECSCTDGEYSRPEYDSMDEAKAERKVSRRIDEVVIVECIDTPCVKCGDENDRLNESMLGKRVDKDRPAFMSKPKSRFDEFCEGQKREERVTCCKNKKAYETTFKQCCEEAGEIIGSDDMDPQQARDTCDPRVICCLPPTEEPLQYCYYTVQTPPKTRIKITATTTLAGDFLGKGMFDSVTDNIDKLESPCESVTIDFLRPEPGCFIGDKTVSLLLDDNGSDTTSVKSTTELTISLTPPNCAELTNDIIPDNIKEQLKSQNTENIKTALEKYQKNIAEFIYNGKYSKQKPDGGSKNLTGEEVATCLNNFVEISYNGRDVMFGGTKSQHFTYLESFGRRFSVPEDCKNAIYNSFIGRASPSQKFAKNPTQYTVTNYSIEILEPAKVSPCDGQNSVQMIGPLKNGKFGILTCEEAANRSSCCDVNSIVCEELNWEDFKQNNNLSCKEQTNEYCAVLSSTSDQSASDRCVNSLGVLSTQNGEVVARGKVIYTCDGSDYNLPNYCSCDMLSDSKDEQNNPLSFAEVCGGLDNDEYEPIPEEEDPRDNPKDPEGNPVDPENPPSEPLPPEETVCVGFTISINDGSTERKEKKILQFPISISVSGYDDNGNPANFELEIKDTSELSNLFDNPPGGLTVSDFASAFAFSIGVPTRRGDRVAVYFQSFACPDGAGPDKPDNKPPGPPAPRDPQIPPSAPDLPKPPRLPVPKPPTTPDPCSSLAARYNAVVDKISELIKKQKPGYRFLPSWFPDPLDKQIKILEGKLEQIKEERRKAGCD